MRRGNRTPAASEAGRRATTTLCTRIEASARRELNPRLLLGRKACHHNTSRAGAGPRSPGRVHGGSRTLAFSLEGRCASVTLHAHIGDPIHGSWARHCRDAIDRIETRFIRDSWSFIRGGRTDTANASRQALRPGRRAGAHAPQGREPLMPETGPETRLRRRTGRSSYLVPPVLQRPYRHPRPRPLQSRERWRAWARWRNGVGRERGAWAPLR